MSTPRPEVVLNDIQKLNERYWGQIAPLERKLAEVEASYQAARRQAGAGGTLGKIREDFVPQIVKLAQGKPIGPVKDPAQYEREMRDLAERINALYAEWEQRLRYINPPAPGPKKSGSFASRIPWPSGVPEWFRRGATRVLEQGGVPLSKRVQIVPSRGPYGGGNGVAVEFAKW